MRIGCDKMHYAIVTMREGKETWATPVALPGCMSLNINPNPSIETAFYDDGPGDSAATLGNIEVEINKNALTTAEKAALLGHLINEKGALIYDSTDVAPYVALGFRTLKSNGKYRYVWLLKGRFMEPEDNNNTKGDSIEFQNDVLSGRFLKVDGAISIKGKDGTATVTKYPWKTELDEEHEDADAATATSWFTTVYTGASA